jgi:hypothetical protein
MEGLRGHTPSPLSSEHAGESSGVSWHPGSAFALLQLAPPLAQSAWFFASGLVRFNARQRSVGITFARAKPDHFGFRVGFSFMGCLTFRSSRTPPALPSALSQHLAISAPFIASVQAGPLSFIR